MKVPNLMDLGESGSNTKTFVMTTTIKDNVIKALPDKEEIIIVFFRFKSSAGLLNSLYSCIEENPAKKPPIIKTAMTAEKIVVCRPKVFPKKTNERSPEPKRVKINCMPEPVNIDKRLRKIGRENEFCAIWLNSEAVSEAKFERNVVRRTKATMIDTNESITKELMRETQWIVVLFEEDLFTFPFSSIKEGSMYIFQRFLCSTSGSSRQ